MSWKYDKVKKIPSYSIIALLNSMLLLLLLSSNYMPTHSAGGALGTMSRRTFHTPYQHLKNMPTHGAEGALDT